MMFSGGGVPMNKKYGFAGVAFLACVYSLHAAVGDVMAETETAAAFDVWTSSDATYAATTADELSALQVSYFAEETVTATAWDGATTMLVDVADSSGSVAFPADKGGVWTLVNSAQGTARIGVPWSVFQDGGDLAQSGDSSAFGVDSVQEGPNRKTRRADALPVAYSGDNWGGDASKTASLTVLSPDAEETTRSFAGTGTESFGFDKLGRWKFSLQMEDGSVKESSVLVLGGLVVKFR